MFGGTHKMKTFDGLLVQAALRFDEQGYAGVSLETVRRRAKEIFGESAYSASVMPERVKKELKK